jgi:hypothetical protein
MSSAQNRWAHSVSTTTTTSLSVQEFASLTVFLEKSSQPKSWSSNLRALFCILGYEAFWTELARPDREDKSRRKKPWHCITLMAATNKEIRSLLYNDPQPWMQTAMVIDAAYKGLGIRMLMRMLALCQNDFQRSSIDVKNGKDLVPISYIWYGHHYKAFEALQVSLIKYGSIHRMLLARQLIMSSSIRAKSKRESAKLRKKKIKPTLRNRKPTLCITSSVTVSQNFCS